MVQSPEPPPQLRCSAFLDGNSEWRAIQLENACSQPPVNWVALSVDDSYSESDGTPGACMILRNAEGAVIFASCRHIFHWNDALEFELHAIIGGMALALQWPDLPVRVQSDSTGALSALIDSTFSRSAYGHLVDEIKNLVEEREFVPKKYSKSRNRVAHVLANYSRSERNTKCWLHQGADYILDFCNGRLQL